VPQFLPDEDRLLVDAWIGVAPDYGVMFLSGMTFGQIPAIRARADALRDEYGSFLYYTLSSQGAGVTVAVIVGVIF
jgi:hypothetical protein